MALTASELWRVRAELGYNTITVDAATYISYVAVFETILSQFVSTGAATTSSTSVAAGAGLVTLTVASAANIHVFDRIAVDVDSSQEISTVRSVSGSAITCYLSKAHAGTYPVIVEAGESIVRDLLGKIGAVKAEMATTMGEGALKKVDELEWYNTTTSTFGSLGNQLNYWREELAAVLGIPSMWNVRATGSQTLTVY